MLKIIIAPNPILTTLTKPVINFDKQLEKIIKEMERTLVKQTYPQGVGLAAPQVGINLQIFIIKPTKKSKITIFINPNILEKSDNFSSYSNKKLETKKEKKSLEGCLSIPKIWGPIKRANKVLLQYQTIDGKKKQQWFSDFEAVIIQHEVDHLNGILFTQRALEQKIPLYEEVDGKLEKISY